MIHKILRQSVKSLTVDEKHCLLQRGNLTQPIAIILLSQKGKIFCEFVFTFSKSVLSFKHLPEKDEPDS